jgi:hypothetical protein
MKAFWLRIFAAGVKIHQGFQSLVIPKFCFGYNGLNAQETVLPQDDASPSKNGSADRHSSMGCRCCRRPSSIDTFDAHVLPSQAPRACNGHNFRDAGWGLRRRSCALGFARKNVFATFDGGMWGLVRLPGTGCARREN